LMSVVMLLSITMLHAAADDDADAHDGDVGVAAGGDGDAGG